jgi:hypothetical protein
LTTLKTAELAPIPKASVKITRAVSPGERAIRRNANRTSAPSEERIGGRDPGLRWELAPFPEDDD